MRSVSIVAVFVVLFLQPVVQADYWEHLWTHYGKGATNRSESIRLHCGRNRYSGSIYRHGPVTKRIIGGIFSRVAEWPWLVSLRHHEAKITKRFGPQDLERMSEDELKALINFITSKTGQLGGSMEPVELTGHICGGALISPKWILTAKHCFENSNVSMSPERWTAVIGEHNIEKDEEHQIEHEIERIVRHPAPDNAFVSQTTNDIALVKLKTPAILNENVQVVCLPYPDEVFKSGQRCSVAGWGYEDPEGSITETPKHIQVPLVPHEACRKMYKKYPGIQVLDTMLCAGGEIGIDSCMYDSGGPLVCRSKEDGEWIAAGIVSFGMSCGTSVPAIYTRITSFLEWIKDVTSRF